MTEKISLITEKISNYLWGFPLTIILIAGGIFLSVRLGFPQLHIIKIFMKTKKTLCVKSKDGISAFSGFSTALAAAVGTGSVTGVGTALFTGGPGAIFWMWVSAFLGMGISYCENYLGRKYSRKNKVCGAVNYLEKIGRGKILAVIYAFCSVLASLGMGNIVQANSITNAAKNGLGIPLHITAFALVIFTALTVSGENSATRLCTRLVPVMAVFFCLGSFYILFLSPVKTLSAFEKIFRCALSPKAFAGGILGSAVCEGLKRGAFSNEAGLGSSVAANSSCCETNPENSGILGMAEVFLDTIVICTITALVILSGGDISSPDCAFSAYKNALGNAGGIFISITLILFALATIAGWFYIGEKSFIYLFPKREIVYRCLCIFCVYLGGIYNPVLIWNLGDIFNALTAIPNMTGLLVLSKEVIAPDFHKK